MPEILIAEEELKTASINDTIIHKGVTSCLTITAILDDAMVGLHIVQFTADGKTYEENLPGHLKRFVQALRGRPVRKLILVAPFDFYPPGIERSITSKFRGKPKPDLHLLDISHSTKDGNDVHVIGPTRTIEIEVQGNTIQREQWLYRSHRDPNKVLESAGVGLRFNYGR